MRVGFASPSTSTICFNHRKFNQEAAAPSRNPAPHVQPRAAIARITPPDTITNITLWMRTSDRSNSPAVIACIPHQLPHKLHETGGNTEQKKDDVQKICVECLV